MVPEHTVLSEKDSKDFLGKYNIKPDQLPKILHTDPAVISIGAKSGQIVKIERKSQTAKYATAYRLVVESEGESSPDIIPDVGSDMGSDSTD